MDTRGVELMRKQEDCEKIAKRIIQAMVQHKVPSMKVEVRVAMIGPEPFLVRFSEQTTLHDFMELGIERNDDEIYKHLDISINKRLLLKPDIGEHLVDLLDKIDKKLRLME
jgi:hypothetical protein